MMTLKIKNNYDKWNKMKNGVKIEWKNEKISNMAWGKMKIWNFVKKICWRGNPGISWNSAEIGFQWFRTRDLSHPKRESYP